MSYRTMRKVAKVIAILTVIALVVTSFSFMIFASSPLTVYASSTATAADEAYLDDQLADLKLTSATHPASMPRLVSESLE